MSDNKQPFKAVASAVFVPSLLFSIAEGALLPIIPVLASRVGADLAGAGLIASMILVGTLIGDIPSGWVVAKIGERNAMVWAAILAVIAGLVCVAAPSPVVLALGVFIIGLAAAVFGLARHAFLTTYVPHRIRARALSTLGGVHRGGMFIGPFIAAGIIALTGNTFAVIWVFVVSCLATVAVLLVLPDPALAFGPAPTVSSRSGELLSTGEDEARNESVGLFRTIWLQRGVLARLGSGAALVGAMRAARQVIMPLWAVSIGLNDSNTALIIGIAGGIDFALFYASGQIMDRFGRIWTAIPSMVGLGLGFLVLSFSHDLPGNVTWFIVVAMWLGLANGVGSGILMTLGADLAPRTNPAPFLGAWRFTGDVGGAGAPLIVSAVTALLSLSVASGIMGVLGLVGAVILGRNIPRYVSRGGSTGG